jgi:NADPH:quinone reductase-like Zn-dependent oxidoreductase
MRRIIIPHIGGPEVLRLEESEDVEPGPGEVRIAVQAAGVNFADVLARMGLYPDAPPLPTGIGYEVAGTIEAVGPDVPKTKEVELGARVIALTRFTGYADRVIVPHDQVTLCPESLTSEEAAAIPVNYLTAWLMLVELGHVQAHHRVLVHSAAGGVGLAALQICRAHGAEVIGTASPGKHARLRELGVAHCIDSGRGDFDVAVREATAGAGVDIVLDACGGSSFDTSYRSLAPMGRLFMFGVSALAPGTKRRIWPALKGLLSMRAYRPIRLMNDNRGVFGVNLGHLWEQKAALTRMLEAIVVQTRAGKLKPVIDRAFPLAEAAAAHARLQSRESFGKIVLVP